MKNNKNIKLNFKKQTITKLTSLQIVGGKGAIEAQDNRLHLDTSCETGDCY